MILTSTFLTAIFLVAPVFASCGYGLNFIHPFEAHVPIPPFDYGVATGGPLNWHNVNKSYVLCGNGTAQSPILLNTSSTLAPAGSIMLNVPVAHDVSLENLGTTVEVPINGTLVASNIKWNLVQFHFHTPSEHRVDLEHSDAEMHMVFAAADGSPNAAVLAFFIKASKQQSTPVLDTIFSHLSQIQTPGTATEVQKVDFASFQKNANLQRYYQYTGSLTTPPCTEGVSWFLATKPLPLRVGTYDQLKSVTKMNNRYTQNTLGQENILKVAAAGLY